MEKQRLKVVVLEGMCSSSQVQSGFRVKTALLRMEWDFLTSDKSSSLLQSLLVDIKSSPSSWDMENFQQGMLRYRILDHGTTLANRGVVRLSGEIIEMMVAEAFLISFSWVKWVDNFVFFRLPQTILRNTTN